MQYFVHISTPLQSKYTCSVLCCLSHTVDNVLLVNSEELDNFKTLRKEMQESKLELDFCRLELIFYFTDYSGWLKTNPNPVNVLSSDSTTGWLCAKVIEGRVRERERERERERRGEVHKEGGGHNVNKGVSKIPSYLHTTISQMTRPAQPLRVASSSLSLEAAANNLLRLEETPRRESQASLAHHLSRNLGEEGTAIARRIRRQGEDQGDQRRHQVVLKRSH